MIRIRALTVESTAAVGGSVASTIYGEPRATNDVDIVATLQESRMAELKAKLGDAFYAEVRRYWPALPDGALLPGYAGVRPKISGPGEPAADFVIQGPQVHGVPGLVNLFGIESPGLTSCLAIGEWVAQQLQEA